MVEGVTERRGRIAWPYTVPAKGTGKRSLILTGSLVQAVWLESAQAVAWHWGVSRWQVTRWRRAVGVPRMTEGTREVWTRLARTKLPLARAALAARRGTSP